MSFYGNNPRFAAEALWRMVIEPRRDEALRVLQVHIPSINTNSSIHERRSEMANFLISWASAFNSFVTYRQRELEKKAAAVESFCVAGESNARIEQT